MILECDRPEPSPLMTQINRIKTLSLEDPGTLFQRKARLEVSGICQGSDSLIQARVNIKLEQIRPSDDLAPGYVSVVEFGTPKARIVKKCRQ